ncbi:hypothetical protein [Oxynema aestuarii]|uniref:Uncharacterized protein n=1 Tax=Oxynema aestuarii AP17 TaxID=2064643 RepID=A0A6H1TW56_9CYAN|nr:hypothetical protein [Oxynema aestuarii]QIZ70387.1 hypothetical protein HCG48_07185 [Oxynema aestuarii AP17]
MSGILAGRAVPIGRRTRNQNRAVVGIDFDGDPDGVPPQALVDAARDRP